jgi:hypothetical protein
MKTSLSRLPSSLEDMRLLSLGPELQRWAKSFEPTLLSSLSAALETCNQAIQSIQDQQVSLSLLGSSDDSDQEMRLANLLSIQTRTLTSLSDQYHKALAMSNALILTSFTRGNLLDRMNAPDGPPASRRRLSSAAGQVVDIVTD